MFKQSLKPDVGRWQPQNEPFPNVCFSSKPLEVAPYIDDFIREQFLWDKNYIILQETFDDIYERSEWEWCPSVVVNIILSFLFDDVYGTLISFGLEWRFCKKLDKYFVKNVKALEGKWKKKRSLTVLM